MQNLAPERKNTGQPGTSKGAVAASSHTGHAPESGARKATSADCAATSADRTETSADCAATSADCAGTIADCAQRRPQGRGRRFSRCAPLISALLLLYASVGHAELGGLPEQFNTDGAAVVSSMSSAMPNYTLRTTTLATGTQVREYVSDSGKVFALAWNGPVLPDLKVLLGQYFDAMAAESARLPRAGRSYIAVNHPEVVIHSGGHMRAFEGSAWIPAQLPAGFTANDVR